ncbi:TPA: beta strand repeat-containing protein, partial [Haemophilus influenzae]
LEKGSTINVSGKEKGGRAIVWGDIALIDGNINAQGKDIAKTGGFVETSGHDLFINDSATVGAKEWLLDPENVSINAGTSGRNNTSPEEDFPTGTGDSFNDAKKNKQDKPTLTNTTIESMLKKGTFVNITAKNKISVNSDINIKENSHLILWSERDNNSGVQINGNITSTAGGSLTVYSSGWVDVHKNITLNSGYLNITTKNGDVAFEQGNDLTITGQGTITASKKGFRFNNVTLNGVEKGFLFKYSQTDNTKDSNFENHFRGALNISGKVDILMQAKQNNWNRRHRGRSHWNVTQLNVLGNSHLNITIDSSGDKPTPGAGILNSFSGLNGISFNNDTIFNVAAGSTVNFDISPPIVSNVRNGNHTLFNGNVSVLGGGDVNFHFNASSSNHWTHGVVIKSQNFNASEGSSLRFKSEGSTQTAFTIESDLTLNATGGNISLNQVAGIDGNLQKSLVANKNITFEGGNITLAADKKPIEIKGNITIKEKTNVTLRGANYGNDKSALRIGGNVTNEGNLTVTGSVINIDKNLTIESGAKFLANPNYSFNVSGSFNNKGDSNITIARGGTVLKDIENTSSLNITTNSNSNYHTIIKGNITNKNGDLNITNNNSNTEIQIGGNISQKEGNLTISSDKVNITKQITIKKGVNGGSSDSSTESQANLTIKTKELKLTEDLSISGFNKAEITAKDNSDLTISSSNSNDNNTDAKKVTFSNVKDSKISANGHKVTLNSKVETSSEGSTEGNDGNNTSLTITAKDVVVNNNITSHKAVSISATSGKITTKTGTTINAATGNVEITAQTGSILGGIESSSGSVALTATEGALAVSNISGNTVTVTANSGALTTLAGSTIKGTESVTTSSQSGEINGDISAVSGAVAITASKGSLSVANITSKTAALTATSGKLTTQAGSTVSATNGVTASSKSGDIGGTISGGTVEVKATESLTTQSNSKIKATTGEANVTSATGTIGGTISGNAVNVTANTGDLTVEDAAKIDATGGAATLTATSGKLTTKASSSITSAKGQVNLSAQDGSVAGSINAANVTLNTTGTLTTVKGSNINATSGTLVINAKDAELNGAALGNHTVVNATNANGSGSVIATTSSRVNITGDLITINGLNIISRNGINTVVLKGVEIDVKYIQPGIASVYEVIEAKRALEKVKDLSDEEREALAKLGVSAVRFIELNNTITVDTQNEFATRPLSRIVISEGRACFSNSDGATVCVNIADNGR